MSALTDPGPPIPVNALTPEPDVKLALAVDYYVTPHARNRYLERVGRETKDVNTEIVSIIRAGVAMGRKSKRKPAWLGYYSYRPRNRAPGRLRYVHDESEQLCFLIHERSYKHQKCWYVVTCMTRRQA